MDISRTKTSAQGFSLMELMIAMVVMLILMGVVATLIGKSMSVRSRETQRADALGSAEAALNVISREVASSGFGIYSDPITRAASNGIIIADSDARKIHIRSNIDNSGMRTAPSGDTVFNTNDPGEDITYYYDPATESIVRYDRFASDPKTSVVVNRISDLTFEYYNYTAGSSTVTITNAPTSATGRVKITVQVKMDMVNGQVNPSRVSVSSEVTLRNSAYMLQQY
jgi:prepilin-type N-terminal cleavage/methylation domain-containing protein